MPVVEKGTTFYTVAEVAEMFGITPHTVRYYTDCGLVPALVRDRNNNRLFDREALNWLEGCLCLRGCGMSIADLKAYEALCLKGDATIAERMKLVAKYRDRAEKELEQAAYRLKYVEEKLAHYRRISNGEIADTTNPAEWEKGVPVRRTELLKVLCERDSHE